MTRTRYKFVEGQHPHFLTCSVVGWLTAFSRPEAVQVVLDSWKFLQKEGRLTLYGYVVMENHLHFLASSPNLSKEVGDFKSFTARKIIDFLLMKNEKTFLQQLSYYRAIHKSDREYQFWQEGSHPQEIQQYEVMLQKLEYMHNNPVRRGYIDDPVHWRCSSARNYAGMPGLLEVVTGWN